MSYDRAKIQHRIALAISEHGGSSDWSHAMEIAAAVLDIREIGHALDLREQCLTEGQRLASCFARGPK